MTWQPPLEARYWLWTEGRILVRGFTKEEAIREYSYYKRKYPGMRVLEDITRIDKDFKRQVLKHKQSRRLFDGGWLNGQTL